MIQYLSVEQVHILHAFQIERYGGARGCRDSGAVEAAAARPAMTFGGEELYPDLSSKAAALMHSLISNHAFVDGNKRVGAHAAVVFLLLNGCRLTFSARELIEAGMAAAKGEMGAEELAIWFRQRIVPPE
jgi:death on curing protein